MSVGISRLSNATEKFSNLAGKFSAAKSAILNKTNVEPALAPEAKDIGFTFSRPLLKDINRKNDLVSQQNYVLEVPDTDIFLDGDNEPMLFEVETEARTEFLNTHIKDKIISRWEVMGEEGPAVDFSSEVSASDLNQGLQEAMPLTLGFNQITDYIELEYMVVEDAQSEEAITPVVSVKPTKDGKAADIYLNGKLVASVAGAQTLQASDIKLVQATS